MGKSSVLRAIRKGVISASRDPVTGGWAIDPAELHRAFPAVANGTPDNRTGTAETELRARLEDTQRTVEDLRRRLDRADDERERLQEQLAAAQERITALLTDQRQAAPNPPPAPEKRRPWWQWRS